MSATAPIFEGESTIAEGVVRARSSTGSLPRLSYLRVSEGRICLVQHFALQADRLIQIPNEALLGAPTVEGRWVRVEIAHEQGQLHLAVRPWERKARRLVVEPVLRCSPDELRALLDRRA
jgi:hypothetical protein